MRTMKDSGVEWIGLIPNSWECYRISMLYSERSTKVSDKDFEPLSVTKQGILAQLDSAAKSDDGDNRKLVLKGDFVINSRSDRRGSCGISDMNGSVSLINTVLMPNKHVCNKFYNFAFRTERFADEYFRWGNGIVADLWSTKWSSFKRINIFIPPLPEQQTIADYLDRKCALIDSTIEKQKVVIEKLNLYENSLISEVMTKGLNPDVPMKDSRVSYCSTIPQHWENRKMISVLSMSVVDGPHESPELSTEGIPYISATAIENGKINFDKMRGYISENYCDVCDKRYIPQLNDILVIKLGASTGQVAMVETTERFNIWVPLAAVRCNIEAEPRFVYYAFHSDYFIKQMEQSWTFGTQQTLGVKTIERLKIMLPPLYEQCEIVDFLDKRCVLIDGVLTKKQAVIDKLTDYKKSLIYECVTGKREV